MFKPTINFDYSNVYVKYLSSLRTYINLNDIHELNEDGIRVKSINFQKSPFPNSNSSKKMKTSYNSFYVDHSTESSVLSGTNDLCSSSEQKQHDPEEVKNVDLAELSFSNENKTDQFLNDIMSAEVSAKLNYVCTPKKPSQAMEHEYENVKHTAAFDQQKYSITRSQNVYQQNPDENIHKAHLVFIDEDIVEQQNCSTDSLNLSLTTKLFIDSMEQSRPAAPSPTTSILRASSRYNSSRHYSMANYDRYQQQQPTQMPKIVRNCSARNESPYRKYLLQQSSSATKALVCSASKPPIHPRKVNAGVGQVGARTNQVARRRLHYSQSMNEHRTPDIVLSASRPINTLSRFHKIVKI